MRLRVSSGNQVQEIVLESDSQILITALQGDSYSLASFGHLVKDI